MAHTPSRAGTSRKKFWKNSRKTPDTLSELFLEFPSRVRSGSPKPYNSRHLRLPEHFQNCLSLRTAGDASFFPEVVPERASQRSWNSHSTEEPVLTRQAGLPRPPQNSAQPFRICRRFLREGLHSRTLRTHTPQIWGG